MCDESNEQPYSFSQWLQWSDPSLTLEILICMYGRRSTNTYSHHGIFTGGALEVAVLSSTAVHKLCTLFEFSTAAHAFLNGLFIYVHFTSGLLLACFPPWLLCATAVAAATGSELSMRLEVSSNVSMLKLQVSSASYCSRQAGRQAKSAPLVCNS